MRIRTPAAAITPPSPTFLYHPYEDLIGQDALDAGIQVEDLEDGKCCWITIYGYEFYCGVVLGVDTNLQFVFSGIIILAAVTIDCLKYVQKK